MANQRLRVNDRVPGFFLVMTVNNQLTNRVTFKISFHIANIFKYRAKYFSYRGVILFIEQKLASKYLNIKHLNFTGYKVLKLFRKLHTNSG